MSENRQVQIDSLPDGKLEESNYSLETHAVPEPLEAEVLCRTLVGQIARIKGCRTVGEQAYPPAGFPGIRL